MDFDRQKRERSMTTIHEASFALDRLLIEYGCDPSMIEQIDTVLAEDGSSVVAYCYLRGSDTPLTVGFTLDGPFDREQCVEALLPRQPTWRH